MVFGFSNKSSDYLQVKSSKTQISQVTAAKMKIVSILDLERFAQLKKIGTAFIGWNLSSLW